MSRTGKFIEDLSILREVSRSTYDEVISFINNIIEAGYLILKSNDHKIRAINIICRKWKFPDNTGFYLVKKIKEKTLKDGTVNIHFLKFHLDRPISFDEIMAWHVYFTWCYMQGIFKRERFDYSLKNQYDEYESSLKDVVPVGYDDYAILLKLRKDFLKSIDDEDEELQTYPGVYYY